MNKSKGIGFASLVLGIIAIVTSFTIVLGIILGIISLILGSVAIAKKYDATKPIEGIVLSIIAIIVSVLMIFIYKNLWKNIREIAIQNTPIIVYINDSAKDSDISKLKEELTNIEYVDNITFVTKEEALEKAKEKIDEDNLLDSYTSYTSPFPAYFEIVITNKKYREFVVNTIESECQTNQSFDIIQKVQ